jgi:hypothetical protein
MSYDLTFLPKPADQSWVEALAAVGSEPGGLPDPEVWERLVASARQLLGDVDVFVDDDHFELVDLPTGIQLSYFPSEAGIEVPYWYHGTDAQAVVRMVYRLGRVVEAITGFAGYDPQLELNLADATERMGLAVAIFDQVAADSAEYGRPNRAGDHQPGQLISGRPAP